MKKTINPESKSNHSLVVGVYLFVLMAFIVSGCSSKPQTVQEGATSSAVTEQSLPKPDLQRLIGRWVRTDGGYIIEIRSASPEGKLDVAYFNPNPIHVGRGEWILKDNKLYAMVELQDVNYPGSTYGLEYRPATDILSGEYFQAVEKSTYVVEFIREK